VEVVISSGEVVMQCPECGAAAQEDFEKGRIFCPNCAYEASVEDVRDSLAEGLIAAEELLETLQAELGLSKGEEGVEDGRGRFEPLPQGFHVKREALP